MSTTTGGAKTVLDTPTSAADKVLLQGGNDSSLESELASLSLEAPTAATRPSNLFSHLTNEEITGWKADFVRDGYVVIPEILSAEKAAEYREETIAWLESFKELGFDRNDRSTWNLDHLPIDFKGGAYFAYSAAHEAWAWRVRSEPTIIKIFEEFYGTKELITSFDSPNISLPVGPHARNDIDPLVPWPHIDGDPGDYDFYLAQSFINFADSGPEDGGLCILPGSQHLHKQHQAETGGIKEANRQGREAWYVFDKEDIDWFENHGAKTIKVNVPPGALVLWDSRSIHYTRSPTGETIRSLLYVCYEPRSRATEASLKIKAQAFKNRHTSTHTPSLNIFPSILITPKRDGVTIDPHHRYRPINEPEETETVLKLAGVLPY